MRGSGDGRRGYTGREGFRGRGGGATQAVRGSGDGEEGLHRP